MKPLCWVVMSLSLLLAACNSGSGQADPEPGVTVAASPPSTSRVPLDEMPEADELRQVIDADGALGDWRVIAGSSTVTPAPGRGPLIEVWWTDDSGTGTLEPAMANEIRSVRTFGDCDAACEARLADAVQLVIQTPPTPVIRSFTCPTCSTTDKFSVFEAEDGSIRGLLQSEMFDALAPIDNIAELTFLFEDAQFAAQAGDGWKVVTAAFADRWCEPTDTRFVMWTIDADGTRTQIGHFDQVVGDDEQVACA